MKNFRKNLMVSEDVKSYVRSGKFYSGDSAAACHDGAIVVEGALENHSVYPNIKDFNVKKITAPAAATDKVFVVDYVGLPGGQINSVYYREGSKTAGLEAPAGEVVRYRRLAEGDSCWFASGNFVANPADGKYATPTASSTLLTVSDTKVDDATNFFIELHQDLVTGSVNGDTEYLCTVVALA